MRSPFASFRNTKSALPGRWLEGAHAAKFRRGIIPAASLPGILAGSIFLIPATKGAVLISGAFATNLRVADGNLNVPSGSMTVLLVDVAGDGFLGIPSQASGAIRPVSDPGLTPGLAALRTGSYFGGDLILFRRSVVNGNVLISLPDLDLTGMESKRFALVWFDGLAFASAPANAPEGTRYGIISGSDWIFPPTNSGNYNFNSTDAGGSTSYYQLNTSSFPSAAFGLVSTTTGDVPAASFTVVPESEPGPALLASAASLLFFRRRRDRGSIIGSGPSGNSHSSLRCSIFSRPS